MAKTYHITWEIDVEADNHQEAAARALLIQRDTFSTATVFDVVEHESNGEAVRVDLEDCESGIEQGL